MSFLSGMVPPSPALWPGQRLSLTISDIAFGGEGVGRVDQMVVFVPFVLLEEEVEVEITEVKRQFARAKLIRVVRPSPRRVAPGCRYFGECGGCQYQHMAYAEQLEVKRKQIAPEGWEVPRDSFFQNNFFLLPKLVETVRDRLRESGVRLLVDAYCGVGFFGIELAEVVESFIGVEIDPRAIQAARRNAAARQRRNGEFIEGRAEELIPAILARFNAATTAVLIDPPRTGCPAVVLESLRRNRPAQVIYVSCHPATLARDLNVLCADRVFELESVTPLDMFPQTQHVECIADLRLLAKPVSIVSTRST